MEAKLYVVGFMRGCGFQCNTRDYLIIFYCRSLHSRLAVDGMVLKSLFNQAKTASLSLCFEIGRTKEVRRERETKAETFQLISSCVTT
jgi:hypothetical protein